MIPFKVAKLELKEMIADHKIKKINHIRNKVLANDPSRRKFWRFISSQVKQAGKITGLYDSSKTMVFDQDQIEAAVLDHFGQAFVGQKTPIYCGPATEDQDSLSISEIDAVLGSWSHFTEPDKYESQVCRPFVASELDSILNTLSDGKASGYDDVPLEFLKHSTAKYRNYLLVFLNKILSEGVVPEDLNKGKCILIFKGGDSMLASQYRPLTVPSNLLRLLTIRMCSHMTHIAEEQQMLGPEQFGFRCKRSTIDAVFVLATLLQKAKAKR